jgi:plastocyanin
MRLLRPVSLLLVLLLLAPACDRTEDTGGAVPGPPTTIKVGEGLVVVKNIAYNPKRVTTPVGREVVWTFDDGGVTHSVTADDGSFDSGRLTSGEFRRAFDQPARSPTTVRCTPA